MLDNEQTENLAATAPESTRSVAPEQTSDVLQPVSVSVTSRRSRRSPMIAVLAAVGAVVLLVVGFLAIKSLSAEDPAPAPAPSPEPRVVPSTLTAPEGFSAASEGSVTILTNTSPVPNVPDSDAGAAPVDDGLAIGGEVGIGVTEVRAAEVVGHTVGSDGRSIEVTFECVRNASDRISDVRYRLDGSTVVVQGRITGGYPGADCVGVAGVSVQLPFADPLPADVVVAAGVVPAD